MALAGDEELRAVERFAETGAGDVKDSRASNRRSTVCVSATTGSVSTRMTRPSAFSASAIAAKPIAEQLRGVGHVCPDLLLWCIGGTI